MSENEHPDLRALSQADGEAATTQEALRDDESWAVNMRNGNAQAQQIEANAVLLLAQAEQAKSKAEVRRAIVQTLNVLTVLAVIAFLVWGIVKVIGLFR